MCMMCDGASLDEVRFWVHGTIARFGWAIMTVEEQQSPSWAYTIGLVACFGHPELVLVGQSQAVTHRVLNHMGEAVRRGERFDGIARTSTCCYPDIELVRVHPAQIEHGLLNMWLDYYETLGPPYPDADALQVVVPDTRYRHRHQRSQPLLDTPDDVLSTRPPNRAQRRAQHRHRRRRTA
jgi:hypothetical protein